MNVIKIYLLTLIIIYIVLIFFLNVVISEAPKERPRLQLKPRSDRTASSEEKETSTKSSIFGAAKPVDTAKKEAEIDQKLQVISQYLAIGLFSSSWVVHS